MVKTSQDAVAVGCLTMLTSLESVNILWRLRLWLGVRVPTNVRIILDVNFSRCTFQIFVDGIMTAIPCDWVYPGAANNKKCCLRIAKPPWIAWFRKAWYMIDLLEINHLANWFYKRMNCLMGNDGLLVIIISSQCDELNDWWLACPFVSLKTFPYKPNGFVIGFKIHTNWWLPAKAPVVILRESHP